MKRGVYVLHLTDKDISILRDLVRGGVVVSDEGKSLSPFVTQEALDALKSKIMALQEIVNATKNVHKASEHYKTVTGYYDKDSEAVSIKSDVQLKER